MEDWKPYQLYSLAQWINGIAFREINFSSKGLPVIKIAEIKNGLSGQTKYTESEYDSKYFVENGDMLFCWSGQPETSIGTYWWRGSDGWLNQHIFKVLPNEKIVRKDFFYYVLQGLNPKFIQIARNKQTTGLGHVTKKDLENIEVRIPDFDEQKAIAKILSSLDDKIELNRQMNATLEAMARALFKAWFVDFEPVRANMENRPSESASPEIAKLFPSEFENGIPKGWEEKPIIEFFTLIGGGTPKTSNPDFWNGEILWYSVVDAPNESDVFVIDTAKKITPLGLEKSSTKLLRKGVTIISARGTVGKLAITGSEMTMNQSCYAIEGKFGDYFNYYVVNAAVAELKQKTHGAVFDTITQDTFKTIYQVLPKPNIISAFEKSVGSIMQKIEQNLRENKNLAEIRDSLLPRLISGKIRVGEAENKTAKRLVKNSSEVKQNV